MEKPALYMKTPLIDMAGVDGPAVRLKMEAYQPCGSFKLRGMDCICRDAIKNGALRLLSSSGGNAGLAVAYVGRQFGVPVTVTVPRATSQLMIERIKDQKAQVIVHGEVWDDAHRYAMDELKDEHTAYIPPFDHPKIWEGHATMIDELKEQMEQPGLIVLSVGGGGMLNGVMEGLIRNGWASTSVLAVETEGAASLYRAVEAGHLVTLDKIDTVATTLGAKRVSEQSLVYAQNYDVIPHLVTDAQACAAVVRFADDYRIMVEPACGASLSAVYQNDPILHRYESVVVIVCGGSAISLEKLEEYAALYRGANG